MLISFLEAKQLLAKYAGKAGKCVDDIQVSLFVKSVIQELLNRGANGSLRKWEFRTQNGMITAPTDLALPIQIRIDDCGSIQGNVYDKFYEFYETSSLANCQPFEKGAVEEINTFYTQYDIPGSKRILAKAQCQEDSDAHLMISGIAPGGREIFMPKKDGTKEKGEYLSISKDKNTFTAATFCKITGIEKTPTKGYVTLYWYAPDTGKQGLLADFRPTDTRPSFRRFRILGTENKPFKVTILGRVRFLDNYSDNDIIPITSLRALKLMAQTLQAEDNDNVQIAQYKEARNDKVIEDENKNNRTPQASVDFFYETSPGSIKTVI